MPNRKFYASKGRWPDAADLLHECTKASAATPPYCSPISEIAPRYEGLSTLALVGLEDKIAKADVEAHNASLE